MSVVFVIGAGASADFGLPVGATLVDLITGVPSGDRETDRARRAFQTKLFGRDPVIDAFIARQAHHPRQTAAKLAATGLNSIDRFVAVHPEHAPAAKLLIARLLMPLEKRAARQSLLTCWHRWFINNLLVRFDGQRQVLLDLADPGSLPMKFISFNYDRLFEYALASHLVATRPIAIGDAMKTVDQLEVLHIYGALERRVLWNEDNARIELPCESEDIIRACNGLRLIHDDREAQDGTLIKAQTWLASASAVVFLGFGFDRLNCIRLGLFGDTLAWARTKRGVWSTGYQLLDLERDRVHEVLKPGQLGDIGHVDDKCEAFMRKRLDARKLGLLDGDQQRS